MASREGRSAAGTVGTDATGGVLTARGRRRPVQNTGHADLLDTPDGGSSLVLLGVRPLGLTGAFSPLGRETMLTDVEWVDDWPVPAPVELAPGTASRRPCSTSPTPPPCTTRARSVSAGLRPIPEGRSLLVYGNDVEPTEVAEAFDVAIKEAVSALNSYVVASPTVTRH